MALIGQGTGRGSHSLPKLFAGDNQIKSKSHSTLFISPITRRRRTNSFSWRCTQIRCQASKWADRLFSDFNSSDSSNPNAATALAPERKVTLPIDFYQILGAETHFLGDGIKRAYEAKVRDVPHDDYSNEAMMGRRQILQTACDTLANPRSRGEYNEGLIEDEAGTLMREVPWNKVPGALCLLQEAGEMGVVIQTGQRLLQENLPKSFKRDVILAMALSYVDISREAMAESPPNIIKSCEVLERALQILQEGGRSLASDLQEQIDETLEEITPRCVLELLSLPLDDQHQAQREEGLQGVRNVLWAVGGGGAVAHVGGFTREEFMNEAFSHMTAAEQVDLFIATPSNIPAEGFEVYAAALAHVAEGFVAKRPQLIQEADVLFSQLQQTNGTSIEIVNNFPAAPQELDVALERAMCALLLGELDECRVWLGLDDENSPFRDPPVVDFILANSDEAEEDPILPGLCMLLESWLTEIVFPKFKDTRGLQFKLGDYYDDPTVLSYLEKLDKGRGSPLAAAAAIARIGVGAGAAIDNVKASAIQVLQRVFPFGKEEDTKEVRSHLSSTISRDLNSTKTQYSNNGHYDQSKAFNGENNYLPETPYEITNPLNNSFGDNSGPEEEVESVSLSDNISSFAMKMACGGVMVGMLALAGLRYLPLQSGSMKSVKQVPSLSTSTGPNDLKHDISKMDARLAENIVRKWQMSKSQALGPTHDISQLAEVLDGEMLNIWTERAKDIAEHGWFWEYSVQGLTIESVTISQGSRKATVEATLQEAARLIDITHPEHNDSYHNTYTTRYEMTNIGGAWKITDGAVLRS
ncbi:hypothetical protein SUGI_0912070 [Cryptomeria japonica]|uniref:protein ACCUMULATION AND REPLICATION OF CHLOROPLASTS 6, chloroplastic n=1 Tax=Cryptomeria japonica TaxID=3369 RepID=UPI002414C672|nr:protein ACCUMULATION AND REPLICATION OF CHLOROPLASTS 6, chloroplastic [Cryptomeria japonica]GLJ43808.1 hypothetical protein SUGI_0912070 [Cryptomeria japonica]